VRAVAGLLLLTIAGCGYQLAGEHVGLPEDVHSLSIGKLTNRSHDYGIEKTLQFALEREVHERGQFRLVQTPDHGDAVLSGTIRDVFVRPVAFDANDQAVEYEITLTVDLTLQRESDGQILWTVKNLREFDEFATTPTVVVTRSSQFQQGTLNASDLQNPEFGRTQLAETERRRAVARLVNQAVRDVYNQMVEDF